MGRKSGGREKFFSRFVDEQTFPENDFSASVHIRKTEAVPKGREADTVAKALHGSDGGLCYKTPVFRSAGENSVNHCKFSVF